jgi:hypothetical protein
MRIARPTAGLGLALVLATGLLYGEASNRSGRPFSFVWKIPVSAGSAVRDLSPRSLDLDVDAPLSVEPAALKKKLGRAALEFLLIMSVSQVKYWLEYSDWKNDWRYGFTWTDQKKRFFSLDAWKFDANAFSLNWSHAPAGALYYNCARANNFSLVQSLLFTAVGSLYWEYIVEWREILSINDVIMTSLGGLPIGEAYYQLGLDLSRRKGLVYRILSFGNPFYKITEFLDRDEIRRRPAPPEPGWHEYVFFLGGQSLRNSGPIGSQKNAIFGVHTRIIEVPEYGKPGRIKKRIPGTLSTDGGIDLAFGGSSLEEMNFNSRVGFWGTFWQDVDDAGSGHCLSLSLGTAFTYWRKKKVAFYDSSRIAPRENGGAELHLEESRNFRDKLSVLHLLGPLFDYSSFGPKSKVRFTADLYADFALVNALAFNRYSAGHDITGVKMNLLYYGYYYALGVSASVRAEAWLGRLYASARLRGDHFHSFEEADRFEYLIKDDLKLHDTHLAYDLKLGFQWPETPLEIRAVHEGIIRRGEIKEIIVREFESRVTLGLCLKI